MFQGRLRNLKIPSEYSRFLDGPFGNLQRFNLLLQGMDLKYAIFGRKMASAIPPGSKNR